ncbi:MAG: hybrid sensor histidine kinase/response regulator, partial [Planctomycetaceae bacterium]
QDAAEWRREETVRLRQWANNGTGNAAVSAQSFLEDTLRARRERQRMSGERKQMAAEREEMAVERSDFAEERDRFSRTQLGLMWIAGLAVAGSFGTRMYVVSRHRKQLQEEVNRKTASLQLAKQEAEEARDRAERADRVKTDFLACMNHEIRNPLNAILGYSQVLQQDSTEDRRKDLRGIESSTEHLLQLANNVLDMSSIENGEIEIHKRAFDLHDLCESVDDILQNSAARKSIAFYVEIASSVPRQVVGDESKIRQVLINLCSNGIKFTQEGQVKLALSVVDELNGQFHLRARVTDTGSGMTDEEMGLLFKPYSQSAMSRDQRMGSGLGLYICKSFVERMGGTITGKNQAEGGAEFEMVVPLEIGSTPAEACEKTAEQSPPVAGTKILIVDDNEANLQTIARLLNAMGFEAKTAHAKATAIAEVQSWQPDVVFLDIHMPGADGFEVANAIRKTEVGPGVKIIAVTGDAIESVRRRALSNGFDAFLPKPIRMKAIEQAIGELLRS